MSEIDISLSNDAIALSAIAEVIVLGQTFCAIVWLRYKKATQFARLFYEKDYPIKSVRDRLRKYKQICNNGDLTVISKSLIILLYSVS